jgi:hypothetical protein
MIGHRHWYYRQSPITLLLVGIVGLLMAIGEIIENLFRSRK